MKVPDIFNKHWLILADLQIIVGLRYWFLYGHFSHFRLEINEQKGKFPYPKLISTSWLKSTHFSLEHEAHRNSPYPSDLGFVLFFLSQPSSTSISNCLLSFILLMTALREQFYWIPFCWRDEVGLKGFHLELPPQRSISVSNILIPNCFNIFSLSWWMFV